MQRDQPIFTGINDISSKLDKISTTLDLILNELKETKNEKTKQK